MIRFNFETASGPDIKICLADASLFILEKKRNASLTMFIRNSLVRCTSLRGEVVKVLLVLTFDDEDKVKPFVTSKHDANIHKINSIVGLNIFILLV